MLPGALAGGRIDGNDDTCMDTEAGSRDKCGEVADVVVTIVTKENDASVDSKDGRELLPHSP